MGPVTVVVDEVSTKDVKTKFGIKPVYSFKGNGTWYKAGWKKPAFNAGAEVEFEYTDGTYGKEVNEGSLRVINSSGVVPSKDKAVAMTTYKGKTEKEWVFPIPPLDWQRNVIRSQAITSAIELTDLAGLDSDPESVIALARKFEAYAAGDLDKEAAEAEANGKGT